MNSYKRKRPSKEFMHNFWIMSQCFGCDADMRDGVVSEYIEHLDTILKQKPDIPIIPYVRASRLGQKANGNFDNQVQFLLRELRRRGANIISPVFREICNGSISRRGGEFKKACELARKEKGVVVAISADRIIRPHRYNPREKQFPALAVAELEMLGDIAHARIATVENPDISIGETYSIHTKRGMQETGHMGGRPKKSKPGALKTRREEYLTQVLVMKKSGMSYREIGKKFDISYRTMVASNEKGTGRMG